MPAVTWFREAEDDLRRIGDPIVMAQIIELAEQELSLEPRSSSIEGAVPDVPHVRWRRCVARSERRAFESYDTDERDGEFRVVAHDYVVVYRALSSNEAIAQVRTEDVVVLRVLSNAQLLSLMPVRRPRTTEATARATQGSRAAQAHRSRTTVREVLDEGRPAFSFQFFPPKTDEGERQLWQAIRELEVLSPAFVSVTYGAGGSTRDRTLRIVERIATETTIVPVGHLTAVGHSRAELRRIIGCFAGAGIRNVLALRGDMPGGPGQPWEAHPEGLSYASELVRMVRELGDFCIGVAAFPEKHPESIDFEADAQRLVEKFEAGADFAVTQFFFTADDYFRLRDDVVARGHSRPILPGIMPVTSVRQIERMTELSGIQLPPRLAERLHKVANDPVAVRAIGVEAASDLSARLLAGGAPGIHFFTLNRSTATREIMANLPR